jgi:hypothetical protein
MSIGFCNSEAQTLNPIFKKNIIAHIHSPKDSTIQKWVQTANWPNICSPVHSSYKDNRTKVVQPTCIFNSNIKDDATIADGESDIEATTLLSKQKKSNGLFRNECTTTLVWMENSTLVWKEIVKITSNPHQGWQGPWESPLKSTKFIR